MVLRAPGEMALGEVEVPRLEAAQVRIRVTHTGVCGTDLKIYNGSIPVRYPRVMGHEVVGEVIDDTHHQHGKRGIASQNTWESAV